MSKAFRASEKEYFNLKNEVKKAYKISQESLLYNNINLQIFSSRKISVYGYANEFSQVVLNLISNAKDVLIERKIEIVLHSPRLYLLSGIIKAPACASAESM